MTPTLADMPTPAQYHRAKEACPAGTIVLFHVGDFYECYEEDAAKAAAALDLCLVRRNGTPVCAVPYHAAELYLMKLIKKGNRVALCDQMQDPRQTTTRPEEPKPAPKKFGVIVNVSAATARKWIARTDAAARSIGRSVKFEVKEPGQTSGIMYPDTAENILRFYKHGKGLTVIAWKDYPDPPPLFAEEEPKHA